MNRELDRSIAAIQATNPNDERLRPENIAAARKAIDQKYKDPKTPKGPSTPLDQSTVTEAKNQLDQLQADYRNAEQKLQAQQRAGLLSYADYVAQRGELISQNKDQVTAAYEGEIQRWRRCATKVPPRRPSASAWTRRSPRPGTTWSRRRRRQTPTWKSSSSTNRGA
ncbi:hypothetical protein [Pseudomonas aeruginosa]|uniref:hypothetical protein n=1 Tax=Pseudomonas aeruginosa TaxID=287 RepID=UPI001F17F1E1